MNRTRISVSKGDPHTPGAFCRGKYYYFTISIPDKQEAELLIYAFRGKQPLYTIPLPAEERIGWTQSVCVSGLNDKIYEYMYRINGKLFPDPCSKATALRKDTESGQMVQRSIITAAPTFLEKGPELTLRDTILYKVHVKGFTAARNSGVEHKGTFLGMQEKLPYLKELGVTTLLLMPCYEYDTVSEEEQRFISYGSMGRVQQETAASEPMEDPAVLCDPFTPIEEQEGRKPRKNYWGYTGGMYMAPKRRYCATQNSMQEFSALVNAIHALDMEVLLEFYFDDTVSTSFVIGVLQYWLMTYGVDGFHLLGRSSWSPAITMDPMLKGCKLLMESVPVPCRAESPSSEDRIALYNLSYQQGMRRFLKGDTGCVKEAAALQKRAEGAPTVGFMTDQDGFTLFDAVSYQKRHNEENMENNVDGKTENLTWNCGIEGPSRKKAIMTLREKQMKNAFLLMMTSQNIPMIYGGDEVCNTQNGNNNAWCQDNETGWISWSSAKLSRRMHDFVQQAIAFRKAHPALQPRHAVRYQDYRQTGYPDVSYHGHQAWVMPTAAESSHLGILYCENYAEETFVSEPGKLLYIIYNMHWEEQEIALPAIFTDKIRWEVCIDTALENSFLPEGSELLPEEQKEISVAPRSIMVLTGR